MRELSEEVVNNIKDNKLRAQIFEFPETVETVLKASQLIKEPPESIVKTLLVKTKLNEYLALIVRGDRKVDNIKLSNYLGCDFKLASADEVLNILKVPLGAVSPLLKNILVLRRVVDPKILEKKYVICGGGTLKALVKISTEDLIKFLNGPEIVDVFK